MTTSLFEDWEENEILSVWNGIGNDIQDKFIELWDNDFCDFHEWKKNPHYRQQ